MNGFRIHEFLLGQKSCGFMSGFDLIKNVTVTTRFNNVRDIKWERVLKLVTVMKFVYFIKK